MDVPRSRKALARTALVAYVALLLAATLGPSPHVRDMVDLPLDKLAHVGLFAGLGAVLYWNLVITIRRVAGPLSVVLAATVAGLIELLQDPLAYRSAEWWDFLAGVAGALVAVILVAWAFGHRSPPGPGRAEEP